MIMHYIILSSSYSKGVRIALHYAIMKNMKIDYIAEVLDRIKSECGENVSVSTHSVVTESKSWQSVTEKDGFFEDIYVVSSVGEFIDLIKKDRYLQGIDVAKYILSKCRCTHLKLEKLVYLCYADYLCKTKQKLFVDNIYAFKYGPVVETVYEKYKGSRDEILELEGSEDSIIEDVFKHMPARSRILFAMNGIEKLNTIDKILEKYADYTAGQLVDVTHVSGGPWDRTDKSFMYSEIKDSIIEKFHFREC